MDSQQATDDRQQKDDGQQNPAASRQPSASFKMDDVQEDNIVPRANLMPRFIVGGLVVGFILIVTALLIDVTNPPPEQPESDVVYLTDETFEAQTAAGIVLVDFYTDSCLPCQMMSPAIESVATRFKEKAVIAKVNTDFNPRLINNFRIFVYPTLVLMQDGREVIRVEGLQAEHELVLLLETAINQQL